MLASFVIHIYIYSMHWYKADVSKLMYNQLLIKLIENYSKNQETAQILWFQPLNGNYSSISFMSPYFFFFFTILAVQVMCLALSDFCSPSWKQTDYVLAFYQNETFTNISFYLEKQWVNQ